MCTSHFIHSAVVNNEFVEYVVNLQIVISLASILSAPTEIFLLAFFSAVNGSSVIKVVYSYPVDLRLRFDVFVGIWQKTYGHYC